MTATSKTIELENMNENERRAWIAALSADEMAVLHVPNGCRFTLICAALAKRALQTEGIAVDTKLRILELLNGSTDLYFTPEMLAMVQPASNIEFQIFKEAKMLDVDEDPACNASFKILTSSRVFGHFLKLNPSITDAIRARVRADAPVPVAVPAASVQAPPRTSDDLAAGEIPSRFFPRASRAEFARGTARN